MRFDRENGKRRPGQGGESSADRTAKSIKGKRTADLIVVAPDPADTGIDVIARGQWPTIHPLCDDEPIGMAVVELDDITELVVFVSARRKRGA